MLQALRFMGCLLGRKVLCCFDRHNQLVSLLWHRPSQSYWDSFVRFLVALSGKRNVISCVRNGGSFRGHSYR